MTTAADLLDEEFLTVVADPVRLRALILLEEQPTDLPTLAEDAGLSPEAMGRHVDVLARRGLIERADGGGDGVVWRTHSAGWIKLSELIGGIERPG
ncbi:MAG TPA: winged helix-turn-helix domain-containing protein [Baekduia sp.]